MNNTEVKNQSLLNRDLQTKKNLLRKKAFKFHY